MARRAPATQLAGSGTLLATTHRLDGGQTVRLRLTRPSDARRVREFLLRLSPETRMRRFPAAVRDVPDSAVGELTFYDPRTRLVVAATAPGEGGEEVLGLAEMVLGRGDVAEVGVVVEESHQNQGIGRLLRETVAGLAVGRGARRVVGREARRAEVPAGGRRAA
jgi:GNAT superfamily N-acetyltransferase